MIIARIKLRKNYRERLMDLILILLSNATKIQKCFLDYKFKAYYIKLKKERSRKVLFKSLPPHASISEKKIVKDDYNIHRVSQL